jgi:phospholipase C
VSGRRRFTRRSLLGGAAAGALGALPGAGRAGAAARQVAQAAAVRPPSSSLESVEHVVFLVQENRSFDHYFGSYRGVRGFDDPYMLQGPGGLPIIAQPGYGPGRNPGGYLLPFHFNTETSDAECIHDINHSWGPQHQSWANGALDSFVTTHLVADGSTIGTETMGYYTRGDLDFYYALADAFTICDNYHCSVLGSTDANRMMTISASIDPTGSGGGPILGDSLTPYSLRWPTMPERLQDAGVSWKIYQSTAEVLGYVESPSNNANNVLAYFEAYGDKSSPLYQKAFLPTFPGDLLADVVAGTLPAVSWVLFEGVLETDEHPSAPVEYGEHSVSQLVQILTANPEIWARTVLFITWDENGGFFDHVPPPTPPAGTTGEFLSSPLPALAGGIAGPVGLGFRVPMLVVSPFARGGWVCSDTFDHTSMLRFLETRFGVAVPNLTPWRRSVTGDLTSTIDPSAPDTSVPPLPFTSLADPTVLLESPLGSYGTGVPDLPQPDPYPVPPNSWPSQEPGVARRR